VCDSYQTWNDFQLRWQPERFGNVSTTRVPISKLWFPDIVVMNRLVSIIIICNNIISL